MEARTGAERPGGKTADRCSGLRAPSERALKVVNVLMAAAVLVGGLAVSHLVYAQRAAPGPYHPSGTAEHVAPLDLTGYWVSIVSEDWRWRMLTAPRGDVASVPLNAAGRKIADEFDPTLYGHGLPWTRGIDCRAYYMAGLMRMPEDLHVTWATPNELKIQTDWGQQTRLIYFTKSDMPHGGPTPQGDSLGSWQFPAPFAAGAFGFLGRGGGPRPPGGDLKVVTTNLVPGWLRRNGVPYGSKTTVTEYFRTFHDPTGKAWFDVFTVVHDPEYLTTPFVTSSDFRRLPNGSSWSPHPCMTVQGN